MNTRITPENTEHGHRWPAVMSLGDYCKIEHVTFHRHAAGAQTQDMVIGDILYQQRYLRVETGGGMRIAQGFAPSKVWVDGGAAVDMLRPTYNLQTTHWACVGSDGLLYVIPDAYSL